MNVIKTNSIQAVLQQQLKKVIGVVAIATLVSPMFILPSYAAPMTNDLVQRYASAMKQAANAQSSSQVSQLVSDDALISLSRKGKTTSLDKSAYLNLLQSSWNQASNYHYDIKIDNIVTTGSQAKADVETVETWVKDGKKVTFVTKSRATLTSDTGDAVLLRAVSQVSID